MPWQECSVMEERLRFVGRLLDGEAMTDVCRDRFKRGLQHGTLFVEIGEQFVGYRMHTGILHIEDGNDSSTC